MAQDIKVDGYDSGAAPHPAPDAAKFGVGVTNEAGVKQATAARIAHSEKLSSMTRFRDDGDKDIDVVRPPTSDNT